MRRLPPRLIVIVLLVPLVADTPTVKNSSRPPRQPLPIQLCVEDGTVSSFFRVVV
jgi:hypothetical protein